MQYNRSVQLVTNWVSLSPPRSRHADCLISFISSNIPMINVSLPRKKLLKCQAENRKAADNQGSSHQQHVLTHVTKITPAHYPHPLLATSLLPTHSLIDPTMKRERESERKINRFFFLPQRALASLSH